MSYDLIIDNYKRSRDWTIKKSEFLRLIFLLMIPLIIFWPMFYGIDIGAADANFYQQLVADALEQYKHHIFPIYVGQSVFDFTGTALGRAPYYLILVGLINLFTFGKLNSLQIEHATIIFSAIAGIYFMYFALRKLIPERRWAAFVFAVFYITSPCMLSMIARLDAYYSYMVVPYVPILFYALVRTYQKNDWLSYVLVAASLSIMQMAHPYVGLWSMFVVGLFLFLRFIEKPKIIFKLFVSAVLFVGFSLWQLATIHSLKLGPVVVKDKAMTAKEHILHHAQQLISQYKTYFFGYFKPINLTADGVVYIQLGYSLWIALLLGLYIVIKKIHNRLLMYLLSCVFFLLIWIYPIPFISLFCWSHVPEVIVASTSYGNERIAMILPALICFIGILALSEFNSAHKTTNRILNISLLIMVSWSFYQSVPFTRYLIQYLYLDNTWLYPENAYHRIDYPSGALYQGLKTGIYEPAMFNRLLTPEGQVIEKFDNKKALEEICRSRTGRDISNNNISEKMISIPTKIKLTSDGFVLPLMKVKILPEVKYLFCFDLIASNAGATFAVQGEKHETLNGFSSPSLESQMLIIPTSTIGNKEKELKITVVPGTLNSKEGFLNIKSFGMIPYHADSLPIKFHSILPYKVTVNNPIQFAYLETAKQFFDGYKAIVNGTEAPVKESPTGRVMIPIRQGSNEVKLIYKGTLLSQISFYISLFSWISLAIYLAYRISNRKGKIKLLVI